MFKGGKLKSLLESKKMFFALFWLGLLVFEPTVSFGFVFEKAVAEGDEGASIKNLQIILNQDGRTLVAPSGAGSPGSETSFFGARTRDALFRFQRLNGIWGEEGLVGPKTRLALNKKLAEIYFAEPSATTGNLSKQLLETQKPFVFKLPSGVRGNATHLADKKSPYLERLEKEEKSKTKKTEKTEAVGQPKIISLSPARGTYGDQITIRGENFTKTNNTIYTGYSILKNVSSPDRRTLTFVADAFGVEYQQSRGLASYFNPFSVPFLVYVENGNGRSNTLIFNYQF